MMETAGRAVNGDSDIDIYTVLFCVLLSTLSLSLSLFLCVCHLSPVRDFAENMNFPWLGSKHSHLKPQFLIVH